MPFFVLSNSASGTVSAPHSNGCYDTGCRAHVLHGQIFLKGSAMQHGSGIFAILLESSTFNKLK